MDARIDPRTVTLSPTTLLDAALVALESGEFAPAPPCTMRTDDGRVCAWGGLYAVARRAGIADPRPNDVHPRMAAIDHAAGRMLGYPGIADAFDGGIGFAEIARALRLARDAVEGRESGSK